ncbi:MAG: sulfotransferase domain-containing protein [Chloroflexota bacterium]
MRIVIASPPKCGNHWIKCLLGEVYGLRWLEGEEKSRITAESLPGLIATGEFPDGSIIHIHNRCTPALCDAIAAVGAHLVTIVRDPYDVFSSLYHWQQERADRGLGNTKQRPRHAMLGKPLDDPAVLEFLETGFGTNIEQANGWLHGGRAIVVRYEDLHRDGAAALANVCDQIHPVSETVIREAVDACRADRMRERNDKMQWHVRSATVGGSRQELTDAHLRIFREVHAAGVKSLGYPIR